jgi:16S rRNA processing protein RimM
MPQDRVCVGEITGAHGVRGLVRLRSFTADPAAVAAYGPLTAEPGGRRFRVALAGRSKDQFLARLDGVADRDAAEALSGTRLFVDRSRLPAPEEDEFYHADLLGLRAERPDGAPLGVVRALHDFGAGDLIEIGRDEGDSLILPFTRQVVPVVDLAAGRIVVEPPAEFVDREAGR